MLMHMLQELAQLLIELNRQEDDTEKAGTSSTVSTMTEVSTTRHLLMPY